MKPLDQPITEHPVAGLEVERRCGGNLIIFTITARLNDEILDTWEALLEDYLKVRQTTDRFTVMDLTQTTFLTFTSLASQRLKAVAAAHPNASGRVGVIVPQIGVLQPIGEFFVQHNNNRLQPNLKIRMFNDRQEGIDWVMAGMDEKL